MDETLRLSPPVGQALFREVVSGGLTIDGHFIPDGVDVGTGIYSIHHNPKYFAAPFQFRPERWIKGNGMDEAEILRARAAWNAFSMGPRGCVGKALAINQLMLTMASLFVD